MKPHDAILLGIGALAGTLALLLMQGARSYGRRDVEGELVGVVKELRCFANEQSEIWQYSREEYEAMLARADAALDIALETNRGPCRRA